MKYKMAAVLSEESHSKDTNEIQEEGDDEIEDIQEAGGDPVSKKKKKKKKKKKGQLCLLLTRGIDNVITKQIQKYQLKTK